MKRFEVRLLPDAEEEAAAALQWYFERSPLAAEAFRSELFDRMEQLERHADRWAVDAHGLRRCLLRRFPYSIHYELQGTVVTVYAIGHQRRRPGYWRKPPA